MNKTKTYNSEEIGLVFLWGIVLGTGISLFVVFFFTENYALINYSLADEICTKLVGEPSTYKNNSDRTIFECELINQTTPEHPLKIILPKQVIK